MTRKFLFLIRGKVKKGKGRGKGLGFPTANITLHKNIPEGIYVSITIVNRKEHQSATFIGAAKTFEEKDFKAESYILNFNKNIYGEWITIKLYKKIRENKKFNSIQELMNQMKKDVLETKKFFKNSL